MTILSIVNTKGGSAKSTTSFNLSYNLSKKHSVLCIDMDDQASLTSMFQTRPSADFTTYNLLFDAIEDKPSISTQYDNISLVPADSRLISVEQSTDFSLPFSARNKIKSISKDYDYTVIDTAGMDGNRLFIALASSDYVLIPLVLDYFNLEAIHKTMDKLAKVHASGFTNVRVLGIIPSIVKGKVNGFPKQLTEKNIYSELISDYESLCLPIVTDRASIRKSQSLKLPLEQLPNIDRDEEAEHQFTHLTNVIINRINAEK